MTDKISDKDKIDWENFLLSKDKLPNKDFKIKNQKYFKTRSLDLHGFSLDKANKLIEKFIINSYQEKVNKLIIVTGKGLHSDNDKDPFVSKDLSILKYSVPEFIDEPTAFM